MNEIDVLLDYIQGSEIGGRQETSTSGAGPAGYEPCLGHAENVARLGSCPACGGTRFVRSRAGGYDPYLPTDDGPIGLGEDDAGDDLRGSQPISRHPLPPPGEDRDRIVSKILGHEQDVEVILPARVQMTGVERAANARMDQRVVRSISKLRAVLRNAPPEVVIGATTRRTEALLWLAKRTGPLEIPAN